MKLLLGITLFVLVTVTSLKGQRLEERYVVHNNQIRKLLLYIPASYNDNNPSPLVFIFHGLGASSENIQRIQFNDQAEIYRYIVAYPQALDSPLSYAWNSGTLLNMDVDDVGFTQTMIALISEEFSIDNKRIYASGFSMGGIMAQRLGCELSNTFAAIASVSGPFANTVRIDCVPEREMPVIYFHGTADETVPYNGSALLGTSSANSTINKWARHNDCEEQPTVVQIPDTANTEFHVEKEYYTDCSGDVELIHYRINNWPHRWPLSASNINATVEIAKFFDKHVLPDIETPTPVVSQELPKGLSVGPNPFSDKIEMVSNINEPITYWQLINGNGQVVKEGNQLNTFINTQLLSSGFYVVVINTGQQILTFTLVK